MSNLPRHSYEEVRGIAIDVLLQRPSGQFSEFIEDAGQILLKKHGAWPPRNTGAMYEGAAALLHRDDPPLVLEAFWDLFRQGAVTLGRDAQQGGGHGIGSVDLATKLRNTRHFVFTIQPRTSR